jgi:large subunit ribosomal protein L22
VADEKEKKVAKTEEVKETKATAKKTETKATTKKTESAKKEAPKAKKTTTAKASTKTSTAKASVKKETASAKAETKNASIKKEAKAETEELVAKATVKYARISSRKVAIVANLIRGKNVDEAMAILQFTPKAGAEVLTKLLKSAIANAENNNQMNHSKLYIAEIYSNQGPTLKRIRPAAKGSAVRIRKRTSNTTIVLKEKED